MELTLEMGLNNMNAGIYWRNGGFDDDPQLVSLISNLKTAGCGVRRVFRPEDIASDTDILLSVGGDGTFLSAARLAAAGDIPVLGVNLGRLGFLSENRPEGIAEILVRGEYVIENRTMLGAALSVPTGDPEIDSWPYALNEITLHRAGAAMLGVDVDIDGMRLPTYWADGLLVATSSGSTAYSLSVGGPIVMPEAKVLVIAPIAPHNLNVRPLVVPVTSVIDLSLQSRDERVMLTMDNRTVEMDPSTKVSVSMAQFSLKRVRLNASNFINALTGKLFWGEDIRNSTRQ